MASPSRIREGLTLEQFLLRPDIDEKPYLEYIDGRIETKVSPQSKHGILEMRLLQHVNPFSEPRAMGLAIPELRCTFAGRSIIPDVVFLQEDHIAIDDRGEIADVVSIPPDIHVEIISPEQSVRDSQEKILFSTSHGCSLGWLIHPYRKTIDVYRPDRPAERLASEGVLGGDPILPGFRLATSEIFGWLVRRRPPGPGADPA